MLAPPISALEDNRSVDMESDLQPRILRGLSMAAVAIAVAVGSAYATPPAPPQPAALAAVPAASSNQIWECTTNGIRTFSDKPCGTKPTLRELNPINGMDATPILPPSRSHQPQFDYPSEYSYPGAEDFYPATQESADSSYPVLAAIPFTARRLANHARRPYKHAHGPAPRRN
jgi:hypothetical protein